MKPYPSRASKQSLPPHDSPVPLSMITGAKKLSCFPYLQFCEGTGWPTCRVGCPRCRRLVRDSFEGGTEIDTKPITIFGFRRHVKRRADMQGWQPEIQKQFYISGSQPCMSARPSAFRPDASRSARTPDPGSPLTSTKPFKRQTLNPKSPSPQISFTYVDLSLDTISIFWVGGCYTQTLKTTLLCTARSGAAEP